METCWTISKQKTLPGNFRSLLEAPENSEGPRGTSTVDWEARTYLNANGELGQMCSISTGKGAEDSYHALMQEPLLLPTSDTVVPKVA